MEVSGQLHDQDLLSFGTHRIGGSVDPRACMEDLVDRKPFAPAGNLNYIPRRPACSLAKSVSVADLTSHGRPRFPLWTVKPTNQLINQ